MGGSENPSGGNTSSGGTGGLGGGASEGGTEASGGVASGGTSTGGASQGGASSGGVDAGGSGGAGDAGSVNTGGVNTGGVTGASGGQLGEAGGGATGCTTTSSLIVSATADSYMSERAGEQKTNYGQDARLRVSGVSAERHRTVIAFDLTAVPVGASVRSAILHLALGATSTGERSLSVYALARAFAETRVTWEKATQTTNWTTPGGDTAVRESAHTTVGDGAQAGALVDFDLSADVGLIVQGSWPNYGWLVAGAEGEMPLEFISRESTFPSERPRLELTLCP